MPALFSIQLVNYLRSLLDYDPETGEFTWRVARLGYCGGVLPGDIAGTKNVNNPKGYTVISVDKIRYRAHILAYWFMVEQPVPAGYEIDHKDRKRTNNRWRNLRIVTSSVNKSNKSLDRNTTGHRGVYRAAKPGRYFARVTVEKNIIHLGYFDSLEEAIAARRAGEMKHFGEYISDRDKEATS